MLLSGLLIKMLHKCVHVYAVLCVAMCCVSCICELNEDTLGVKKVRGQSETALQIGMYDQKL